jgi:hypothetical protein
MKNLVKSEHGAAMFVVLLVLLLLIILSSVFVFAMTTEGTQSARHDNKTQAYYIARTGAEAVAESIVENIRTIESYEDGATGYLDNENKQEFSISVSEEGDRIRIESTGFFQGVQETTTLYLRNEASGATNMALYANNKLSISGSPEIDGAIGYGQEGSNSNLNIQSDLEEILDLHYNVPKPIINKVSEPTTVKSPDKIEVEDSEQRTLKAEDSGIYKKFEAKNNGRIIFDTSDGDISIKLTDGTGIEMKDSSQMSIVGNGKVYLFVIKAEFKEIGSISSTDQLIVYVSGIQGLEIKEGAKVYGLFLVDYKVEIKGENTEFTGAIISEELTITGSPKIKYMPIDENSISINSDGYVRDYWAD